MKPVLAHFSLAPHELDELRVTFHSATTMLSARKRSMFKESFSSLLDLMHTIFHLFSSVMWADCRSHVAIPYLS